MKKYSSIALFLIIVVALIIVIGCTSYNIGIGPVSKSDTLKEIEITSGNSYLTISKLLKDNKLIKSENFYKLYIKLFKPTKLEACTYSLSENMGVKKIVAVLESGCKSNPDAVKITFNEGLNMRKIASIIASNTNNTENDVFATLKDTTYLDELISKYWFITDDIKNSKIYYSLEGYLFPDTYEFNNKDVTVKEIFNTLIEQMNKKLTPFKEEIEKSKYSVHELLTVASMVELEAGTNGDRAGVAAVFYNRLAVGMTLGSDVTAYYGVKKELHEDDLYQSELDAYNAYNTRNPNFIGLPVGPICNPGIDSIKAAIEPEDNNYYYFVADKNGKTYFNVDSAGHTKTVAELKSKGLWFEY